MNYDFTQFKQSRRNFAETALALTATASFGKVWAQEKFPSRPINVVLSAAPGGAGDYIVRRVGQKMSEHMGQPIVIENKPSAGMIVSAQYVRQAKPNGHTLMLTGNGMVLSTVLFANAPYSLIKDFKPVSTIAFFDLALVVDQQSKPQSLKDLVAFGKANPGKLTIATTRIGTTQHLAAELFKSMAKLDAVIVPYKATTDMMQALRSGDAQVAFDIVPPLMTLIAAKQIRPIAVSGSKRFPGLPDVPTVAESGLPGYEATSWNGMLAPLETPDAVIDILHKEIARAVAAPEVVKDLESRGYVLRSSTPEQLAQRLRDDTAKWKAVIDGANIPKL